MYLPAVQCRFLALTAGVLLVVAVGKGVVAQPMAYETRPVTYGPLVARLCVPRGQGKVPVVIAFGGSDGGMNFGDANCKLIAPAGVAVLALAYFKDTNLPQTLDRISMEYFVKAVDFVQTVPDLDGSRIGVVSGSRGSEAALLLASMDRRIKSVAVTTPSNVAWYGTASGHSAWTINGRDVPALALALDDDSPTLHRFERALDDAVAVRNATIPVEKINGPIFLVSATKDDVWPSYRMSLALEAYLAEHAFAHSVTHAFYPAGHAFSAETAPEIRQSIVDHFVRTLGTPGPRSP
jgi:dienelactone hydrolase